MILQSSGIIRGVPEDEARIILSEVVVALQHMHAHGFVHRDVKVENIMLDQWGHVKLVDFGLAHKIEGEEVPMSPMGSLIYMAPELLRDRVGGRHTDWWAVGILAYEITTGQWLPRGSSASSARNPLSTPRHHLVPLFLRRGDNSVF